MVPDTRQPGINLKCKAVGLQLWRISSSISPLCIGLISVLLNWFTICIRTNICILDKIHPTGKKYPAKIYQ